MTKFLTYFSICLSSLFVIASPLAIYAIPQSLSENAKPLTPEQTQEIEKSPNFILAKCLNDLELSKHLSKGLVENLSFIKNARLQLCDSFAHYLKNKCHNLQDLLQYCEFDPSTKIATIDKYEAERLAKLTLPLSLEIKDIGAKNITGLRTLSITLSVINPNLLDTNLVGVSLDVFNEGNLIHSILSKETSNIPAFSAHNVTEGLVLIDKEASNIVPTNSTWRIRGSLNYENFTSGVVSQPIDITIKK